MQHCGTCLALARLRPTRWSAQIVRDNLRVAVSPLGRRNVLKVHARLAFTRVQQYVRPHVATADVHESASCVFPCQRYPSTHSMCSESIDLTCAPALKVAIFACQVAVHAMYNTVLEYQASRVRA